MIDIEQDGVGAFEDDALAGAEGFDEQLAGVGDERLDPPAVVAVLFEDRPPVQRRGRFVVVPYSLPRSRMYSPILLSCSVGNGPPPTRVL